MSNRVSNHHMGSNNNDNTVYTMKMKNKTTLKCVRKRKEERVIGYLWLDSLIKCLPRNAYVRRHLQMTRDSDISENYTSRARSKRGRGEGPPITRYF